MDAVRGKLHDNPERPKGNNSDDFLAEISTD
jgi:hypothetical protein